MLFALIDLGRLRINIYSGHPLRLVYFERIQVEVVGKPYLELVNPSNSREM